VKGNHFGYKQSAFLTQEIHNKKDFNDDNLIKKNGRKFSPPPQSIRTSLWKKVSAG
jgi:hypothetical protein